MKNRIKQKPIESSEIGKFFKNTNDVILSKKHQHRLCDYTSLVNYHTSDLDMAWGTLWVWNKKYKFYDVPFAHHTWNLDSEDNVYDDFYSLNQILEEDGMNNINPKRDSYRYIDGFKIDKVDRFQISERLRKKFKKERTIPKMVFLSEIAWDKNENLHSWKTMEKKWNVIEKDDIIKEIQK